MTTIWTPEVINATPFYKDISTKVYDSSDTYDKAELLVTDPHKYYDGVYPFNSVPVTWVQVNPGT